MWSLANESWWQLGFVLGAGMWTPWCTTPTPI
jgi:hypothetical protein